MANEFTAEELKEVIRAARVFNPSFSEEQFQSVVELEERLSDSGFLEAVNGVLRLEKEMGIPCSQALETYQQLLRENEQLGQEVATRRTKLETVENQLKEAEGQYRELVKETGRAVAQIDELKRERKREEKELTAFRKKAECEKQNIDKELEEYRRKSNVTREEITASSELSEQLASRGFTIEFALDLCQEFAGQENAREELAKALEDRQTLTDHIAALHERAEEQKKAVESELNKMLLERDRRQAEIENLEQARHQLENILSQLQADVAHEKELRRFYYRYHGGEGLLECLASWDQIFFMRCNNPVYAMAGALMRSAGGAHLWTDKPAARCPHCGMTMLLPDEKPYLALNCTVGVPVKLQLE